MKKYLKNDWFTLLELVVVVTIIIILTWILALSVVIYNLKARDVARKENLANIKEVIEWGLLYWKKLIDPDDLMWSYHLNEYNIDCKKWVFWLKNLWHFWNLSKIPEDPKTKKYYDYLVCDRWEYYFLVTNLESWEEYVLTNYK